MSAPVIHVTRINEAQLRVQSDESVEMELSDFFTFMSEGYQFSPLYRKKIWDGKIRLYNRKTKLIGSGLIRHLQQFADDRKYKVTGDLYVAENISLDEVKKYVDDLKLTSKGNRLIVDDYQYTGITKALRYRQTIALSPTGSGKSLIIYSIMRYLLDHKCKRGLLIVPTTSLVEQMYTDFEDYSTENGWSAEANCQKIYQGQSRKITKRLTISTWQSLNEITDKKFFEQFDFIIGDEAHTFAAKSLVSIMTSLKAAKYRIGTSGTLKDSIVHKLVLEGNFGPVVDLITTSELMMRKRLAQLIIKCLVLKYPESECKLLYKVDYKTEIDYLVKNPKRNNFISNLGLSLKQNTLILFNYIEHGKKLYELMTTKDKKRKIYFVYGMTEVEEREKVRTILELENDCIILASYGVFSTGINIKNLHNLVFASPSKSKIRVLQSIGRVLRMADGKDSATLYDIADDLRLKNRVNFTLYHYMERCKLYFSEKFIVKQYNIGLYQ